MTEIEYTTAWEDSETIRTREQMQVLGGEGTNHAYSRDAYPDYEPIDYAIEFVPEVREPAKNEVHGDFDNPGRGASLTTHRWFTVPYGGLLPMIPDTYNSDMVLASSVSHLHELTELSLELRTAKVAELNALHGFDPPWLPGDIVLDWDFGDVDFPLFTYPIGTYGNRLIEVTHAQESEFRDRSGTVDSPPYPGSDSLAFWAIPVQEPGAADPDGGELAEEVDGSWSCDVLEARAAEDARSAYEFTDAVELIVAPSSTEGVEVVTREELDDDWWDAHTWTVARPETDYPTRALPLAGGYLWTFHSGQDTGTFGTDEAGATTSTAEVWFEEDWTPPRHRFRYFIEQSGVPPRRICRRPDGATHGAARTRGGGNTVQSGNRVLGTIL
jgi:hypothetical protein